MASCRWCAAAAGLGASKQVRVSRGGHCEPLSFVRPVVSSARVASMVARWIGRKRTLKPAVRKTCGCIGRRRRGRSRRWRPLVMFEGTRRSFPARRGSAALVGTLSAPHGGWRLPRRLPAWLRSAGHAWSLTGANTRKTTAPTIGAGRDMELRNRLLPPRTRDTGLSRSIPAWSGSGSYHDQ